ncbi:M48 family metalloprotease [Pontibacter sp. MBLB2868]|uniref:M48 family metalloprotease n=1 Tax=Pontibacter sp. MBLB2868 TaxID=3451555 RepID=UPI003F74DE23
MSAFIQVLKHKGAAACALLLLLSTFCRAYAQQKEYFPFYTNDTVQLHEQALAQRNSVLKHFVVPQGVSSDYKKSYKEIVERSAENSYKMMLYGAFQDSVVAPFIQSIYSNIIVANKELAGTKLVLSRNPKENAYAMANGTIFFNIGLLAKLENESQIAFVLCHELAHIKLNHMDQSIREFLDVIHDKSFKKQLNQVSKEKYNRNAKMGNLLEELSLGHLFHSRSLEKEADSLGYVLLSRTRYRSAEAYTALQVLKNIDDNIPPNEVNFSAFLSCEDFNSDTFQKQKNSSSIFDITTDDSPFSASPDTLKTHPDIEKRLAYMQELIQSMPASNNSNRDGVSVKIKDVCQRELVQSWFDSKNYDFALYNALLLLKDNPESAYLKSMVVLCLYELKRHLLLHQFAEIMQVESDYHSESFNRLIKFLNSLNTSDYKPLSVCLAQKVQPLQGEHEHVAAAQYALRTLQEEEQGATEALSIYLGKYKHGRFLQLFIK